MAGKRMYSLDSVVALLHHSQAVTVSAGDTDLAFGKSAFVGSTGISEKRKVN